MHCIVLNKYTLPRVFLVAQSRVIKRLKIWQYVEEWRLIYCNDIRPMSLQLWKHKKKLVIGQIQHKPENKIRIMYKNVKVDDEKKNKSDHKRLLKH